jgi:hypothetical protein
MPLALPGVIALNAFFFRSQPGCIPAGAETEEITEPGHCNKCL